MVIRRLETGDEAIACQVVATFKNAYPTINYMAHFLDNKDNYFYVAEVAGKLVGFLLAYKMDRCDGERAMMFLYEIEVLSQRRRQGIGKALVQATKKECEQKRFLKMFVITDGSNEPAKNLYSSAGGRRVQGSAILFHYGIESDDQAQTGAKPRLTA
jgi:aminoglycoside 3-N-acetyltransferase I